MKILKKINYFTDKGGGLVSVVIIVSIVSAMLLFVFMGIEMLNRDVRSLRVRSLMSIVERNIRTAAVQPFLYVNCDSAVGPSSCLINWIYIERLGTEYVTGPPSASKNFVFRLPVTGANCTGVDANCGFVFREALIDTSGGDPKFRGYLDYEGREATIKPVLIELNIPKQIVQENEFRCPNGFFAGFNTQGQIICAVPSVCGGWNYASDINPLTLDASCENLPTGDYGLPGRILSALAWLGGQEIVVKTINRHPVSWWGP